MGKIMILYFSGTGNSRYTAQVIQREIKDELVSINDYLKKNSKISLHSNDPFVFVAPTYAWRLPKVVEDFIRKTEFTGSRKAYFLLTCGTHTHNAVHYADKLCSEKNFEFMGFSSIVMPENYIAMFEVPEKAQADAIIESSLPKIKALAVKIKNKQPFEPEKINLSDKMISRLINPVFYKTCVSAKGFYTTAACTGCRKCEVICPLNNIHLSENKPVWGKSCTHCMACICACPAQAIEYKKKSQGKPRFYNAGYVES